MSSTSKGIRNLGVILCCGFSICIDMVALIQMVGICMVRNLDKGLFTSKRKTWNMEFLLSILIRSDSQTTGPKI